MKNLEELTFEETKQLTGGSGIPEPWHGLPPNYINLNPHLWPKTNYKKGLRINFDDVIFYSKQFI